MPSVYSAFGQIDTEGRVSAGGLLLLKYNRLLSRLQRSVQIAGLPLCDRQRAKDAALKPARRRIRL